MNTGPNMFIRARLFWDADAPVDGLLDDYYTNMFGPSAESVRRYWDVLEQLMHHGPGHAHEDEILKVIYPIEKIRPLEAQVREAEAKADTELIRRRVLAIRFSYDNLMLYLEMRLAEDEGRFADAARSARRMLDLHLNIEQVDPVFYKIGDLDRGTEDSPHLTGGWVRQNEARAGRTGGTQGQLVALLPDEWQFRTDPHQEGILYRWFDPDLDTGDWGRIRTTRIWEVQGYEDELGHGYDGIGWYRTRIEIPESFTGRPVQINFGGVFGKMQVWIEGRFVAYRPFALPWWRNGYNDTFDIDASSALTPGRPHTIVIRVDNKHEWGGIFRRVFLWSPNGKGLNLPGSSAERTGHGQP